jgi:DNA-binding CsgD family transcriptional regulator/tetratricopeptide (TPR) repeat protein
LSALRPAAAEREAAWFHARASELERDFPFGVVRQLFEPAVAADPTLLEGAAALAGSALGVPGAEPANEPGYALLHGLFWLVAGLAERGPVVLCVDDLQWADGPSLRFLDHLALRLDGLPVMGAFAARAGDATLSVGPIARLLDHPDSYSLVVGALGPDAVAAILADELQAEPGPELLAACLEVTGGNAFLVREVAGELRRSGATDADAVAELAPPAIVRSLRLRLESLDAASVALAQAVAVLGGHCEIADAARLAGIDRDAALQAADTHSAEEIFTPGRPLQFVHAVVLSAARETLGAARRDALHRGAAAAAAERGELDAAASHLLAVDPSGDPEVVAVLHRAARGALQRGAPDVALTYLRRALMEPPVPQDIADLLARAASAAGSAADTEALALAERGLRHAATPAQRLAAAREAAIIHIGEGRHEKATDLMADALAPEDLPPELRMAGEGLLLISATISAAARSKHRERLAGARALDDQLGADSPAGLAVVTGFEQALVGGEVDAGADRVERAIADGRLLTEVTPDSPFPYIAGNTLIVAGRYGAAEQFVSAVIADAASRGSIRAFGLATAQRGLCRLRAGRLGAAMADAGAAIESVEGSVPVQTLVASGALAGAQIAAGDLGAAAATLAAVPTSDIRPDTHVGAVVLEAFARLRLAQARWQATIEACDACAAWEMQFGVQHGGWITWRAFAAQAHAALGDTKTARALADEGVALARKYGVPRTLGLSLQGAGLVARDGVPLLEEAVRVLTAGGVQAEAAAAQRDLGLAQIVAGDVDAARETLDAALMAAEVVGAVPVAQTARDALVSLGARPRRRSVAGADALTPAERRVAELAAAGQSNRDVAEGLFLTLKTVENHLTSVYRKLGIGSRAQLADRLA